MVDTNTPETQPLGGAHRTLTLQSTSPPLSIGLEKPRRFRKESGLNENLGRHESATGPGAWTVGASTKNPVVNVDNVGNVRVGGQYGMLDAGVVRYADGTNRCLWRRGR